MKKKYSFPIQDSSIEVSNTLASTQAIAADAIVSAAVAVAKASHSVVSGAVASVSASGEALVQNAEEATRLAHILSSLNRASASGMETELLRVFVDDAVKTAHAIADRAWDQAAKGKKRTESTATAAESADRVQKAAEKSAELAVRNAKKYEESQKKTVEDASASRLKTLFIANMSHEIRTPLAVIKGFAELLAGEHIGSAKNQQWVMSVLSASQQLEILINDMLDISKIEAGKLDIDRTEVSMQQIILEASALMSDKAQKKGLRFSFVLDGPVPSTIRTDKTRLQQILINVIGNAIKFTEDGSVEVTAKLANQKLIFYVRDEGIGITPDQATRLFQAFSQADSSITRKYGGTGLGLTLARQLARMLGGDVVLCKQAGKGSTFMITIDPGDMEQAPMIVDLVVAEKRSPLSADPAIDSKAFEGFRILLVEDAPDVASLLSHVLVTRGAQVKWVENGLEGVQWARRSPYDLILMDIQMPEMNGYEATRQLRLEGFTLPIYALTAHAMKGEQERCLAAGFTDYLSKPVSLKKLYSAIGDYRDKVWH